MRILRNSLGQHQRPLSLAWFTLFSALWLISAYNLPFWTAVAKARNFIFFNDIPFLLSTFVVLALTFNSLLTLLTFRHIAKAVVIFLVLLSAVAASFAWRLGTLIDKSMIQNVFETDWNEVLDLANASFFLDFLLFGLLPATLILRVRLQSRPMLHEISRKLAIVVGGTAISALLIWAFSAEYSSLLRNHRELRFMLTPTNVINSTAGYLKQRSKMQGRIEIAGDAYRAGNISATGNPSVLILVIGETARAADFSLKDHARLTNPLLQEKKVIFFPNVTACGTATAVSLPCMFSDLGEADYEPGKAQGRDNLLDVLVRSGVNVIWMDNNSGCKGLCSRAAYEQLAVRNIEGLCHDGECMDEILLTGLQERLANLKGDTVLVLHMKGSHGPAYFRRYPQRFDNFTPTCKSADLSRCNPEIIHNAYDNTILYTDFVLAEIIELLKNNEKRMDSALLYISDHGESLGENGLYLHGMPKLIAPRKQTEIPMLAWFSESFATARKIDQSCVITNRQRPYSHDNMFHSVLGLFDVRTRFYKSHLDMFVRCR